LDDLETAAAQAPLAGKIRSFAAWAGAGRRLTRTGKITLADARHLVELPETGDTIDPKIGDRVFRTTSSAELGGLTRIAEGAKPARLVRVTGNRLAQAKKNAAGPAGRPAWCWRWSRHTHARQVTVPAGSLPAVAGRGRVRRHRRRAADRPYDPAAAGAAGGSAGNRQRDDRGPVPSRHAYRAAAGHAAAHRRDGSRYRHDRAGRYRGRHARQEGRDSRAHPARQVRVRGGCAACRSQGSRSSR